MDKYTSPTVVGEGTYGTVARCRETSTGRLVAVKRLKRPLAGRRQCEMIVREIGLLRALADDHVVPLIEAFRHGVHVYMVFPLLRCNLYQYMRTRGGTLSVEETKRCVYQVLKGLDYIHGRSIVHRDLKPENILLAHDGIVKICDFGVSRMFCPDCSMDLSTGIGTLWYQAPEILMRLRNYDCKVDVWSVGILITELVSHWPVVAEYTAVDQVYSIVELLGGARAHYLDAVREYLRVRGVTLPAASPGPAGGGGGNDESYAVVDTVSALRRVYAEWPVRMLYMVACCLLLDPGRRRSAAQLLRAEFFTTDSFSARFDRELRVVLRGHGGRTSDTGYGGDRTRPRGRRDAWTEPPH